MMLCECGTKLQPSGWAEKDDLMVWFFTCPKCNARYEQSGFRYGPSNCPKHHWEYKMHTFYDDPDKHRIAWVMGCSRCGAENRELRFDSEAVGLREAVDMEDPRTQRFLEVNKFTAPFIFGKDGAKDHKEAKAAAKDFWS